MAFDLSQFQGVPQPQGYNPAQGQWFGQFAPPKVQQQAAAVQQQVAPAQQNASAQGQAAQGQQQGALQKQFYVPPIDPNNIASGRGIGQFLGGAAGGLTGLIPGVAPFAPAISGLTGGIGGIIGNWLGNKFGSSPEAQQPLAQLPAWGPQADLARRNFQTRTVPSLAERFTAGGAQDRSTAFEGALGEHANDLETNLVALAAQYGVQGAQFQREGEQNAIKNSQWQQEFQQGGEQFQQKLGQSSQQFQQELGHKGALALLENQIFQQEFGRKGAEFNIEQQRLRDIASQSAAQFGQTEQRHGSEFLENLALSKAENLAKREAESNRFNTTKLHHEQQLAHNEALLETARAASLAAGSTQKEMVAARQAANKLEATKITQQYELNKAELTAKIDSMKSEKWYKTFAKKAGSFVAEKAASATIGFLAAGPAGAAAAVTGAGLKDMFEIFAAKEDKK